MYYFKSLFFTAACIFSLLGCDAFDGDGKSNSKNPEPKDITETLSSKANFSTLTAALKAAGLDQTLADTSKDFTVFAPTDAAFALLGQDAINSLLANADQLTDTLTYHVIAGAIVNSTAAINAAGSLVEMANGKSVAISLSGSQLYVNLSKVTSANMAASNGIIHVIDAVLLPATAQSAPTQSIAEIAVANGSFTTLVAALQAAELDSVLADESKRFTVFAPTDAAFAILGQENIEALLADKQALSSVLLQHVISDLEADSLTAMTLNGKNVTMANGEEIPVAIVDGKLKIGGANVVVSDIHATNGVIHVVDAVITGNLTLPVAPTSVLDVAKAAGGFTTLIAALEAADLDSLLDDKDGVYTVFAPTDAAFAALGEGVVEGLLANPTALANILQYHVIVGSEVTASQAVAVANGEDSLITMANGDSAGLSTVDGNLWINTSLVTSANVMAGNGVIHVLDKVLLPPAESDNVTNNIVEMAVAAGSFTTLVTALQATGLDATLADETAVFTVFAPTDAAFALLGEETINSLLSDTDALSAILLNHVIAGAKVDSVLASTFNGSNVTFAGGGEIPVAISNGVLTVGGAKVISSDIHTTNGIIHVIDAVITVAND